MAILLPNLDDRRWIELVEEGRALIPLYAPEFTDHNIHDPGVTLIELFAWIAEMDLYQLNRISETHRRKFLALAGVSPRPPQPSRSLLELRLDDGSDPVVLPPGIEFGGLDPFEVATPFRTLTELTVGPGQIKALQVWQNNSFRDLSARLERSEDIQVFGGDPQVGDAFYLGLDEPLPVNTTLSLFFVFSNPRADSGERERILDEEKFRKEICRPIPPQIQCDDSELFASPPQEPGLPPHHSVRTAWEFLDSEGNWRMLDAAGGEVADDTRCFTLNGSVQLNLPKPMSAKRLGAVEDELFYLRCRVIAGAYDAPPVAYRIIFNGVEVEQAVPVHASLPIAIGAEISGEPPSPNKPVSFYLEFNSDRELSKLAFAAEAGLPEFLLLSYNAPTSMEKGELIIEGEVIGFGVNEPNLELQLKSKPVQYDSFQLFTLEPDENERFKWRAWQAVADFLASKREGAHFVLDATAGVVLFGDGEHGRVVPAHAPVFAVYRTTRAERGLLDTERIDTLEDSLHNRVVLSVLKGIDLEDFDLEECRRNFIRIANPLAATGGAGAETVVEAAGRVFQARQSSQRAVTVEDIETLVLQMPGVQLARAAARPNLHPVLPCLQAPGIITVVILPELPRARPMPDHGLIQAVAHYLTRRGVLGSRFEVVGPKYTEVSVQASVRACVGINRMEVQQRIIDALDDFFDPLGGGPKSNGWPFGRDVYRSEILQVIDETPGVDHVLTMHLIQNGGEPQCGNLCIGALGLVAAGQHEIEVL